MAERHRTPPGAVPVSDAERRRATRMWKAQGEISRWIVELELPPGALFTEGELASQLGLSKTPVREALLAISNEGLVFPRPGTGYRVSPITLKDARNLLTARAHIEGELAALAASHGLGGKSVVMIEELASPPKYLSDPPTLSERLEANRHFHNALSLLAENPYLTKMQDRLWNEFDRFIHFVYQLGGHLDESNAQHEEIALAILSGDAAGARQAAASHVKSTEKMVVEAMLSSEVLQGINLGRVNPDGR